MLGSAQCGLITHFLPLILLCVRVLSLPHVRRALHVKEDHTVPDIWVCNGRAPPSHLLNLSIALKPRRFEELERHLYESKSFPNRSLLFLPEPKNSLCC